MDNEKQITVLDPTSLTTQQLWREIGSLKELVFNEINSIKDSIKLSHEDIVRFPTEVDEKVGALKELVFQKLFDEHNLKETKFEKVDQRFDLLESARIEQKNDVKANTETALNSARQLVEQQNINNSVAANKTEATFNKLIDQQANLISSVSKGFYDQIDEIKKRLTTIEGIAIGALGQKTEKRSADNLVIGIIGLVCAIVFGIIGYIIAAK